MDSRIIILRMERQFLTRRANKAEYDALYRDIQPGLNVYWNGFGQPPTLSCRADFDDIEYNRLRLAQHELIKGRFAGGNLGWIVPDDIELFAALYSNPGKELPYSAQILCDLIYREGPLTIQQMKEETRLLVKEITPALHKLQQAFLVFEDQYDGEWDRGWYRFGEFFPNVNLNRMTYTEALKIVLKRFAYRSVLFDTAMAKSFYKLPEKDIKAAVNELVSEGALVKTDDGYMLIDDAAAVGRQKPSPVPHMVYALHRNDFLYKINEHILKDRIKALTLNLPYDSEPLQYLLIDGEFHGACVGRFRNGPYDLNDIVCDFNADGLKNEIIEAVTDVNFGKSPLRFMGKQL